MLDVGWWPPHTQTGISRVFEKTSPAFGQRRFHQKTRTTLFLPPLVSFFVVLFLFVLVFLCVLFSLLSFVLRSLAILPGSPSCATTSMVLDIVEGQGRGGPPKWPKFIME